MKVRNVNRDSADKVIIDVRNLIAVKHSQKQWRRGVHTMEDECSLGPGHPSWRQAVVNDVRPRRAILIDQGHKWVGLITKNARLDIENTNGVHVWQIVTR